MTIPSSELVSVTPSVLAAGGNGVAAIGLLLTQSTRPPLGSVLSFPDAAAVEDYFGPGTEATDASVYFTGFEGAAQTPAALLVAQYPAAGAAAFLRGGNVSGLTLAQLQAISGSLDITIDGYAHNAASLNLSSATSFTSAASIIATAINGSLATEGTFTGAIAAETASFTASISGNVMTVTNISSGTIVNGGALSGTGVTSGTVITGQISGTPGGIGTYAVSASQVVASTTVTESYGTLTATADTGVIAVGQTVVGSGVTAGTIITQLGSGTGGNGTYYVNLTQTVASESMTTTPTAAVVSYDSVSGGFVVTSGISGAASSIAFATGTTAAALELTSATGAVISQGAAPAIPSAFMTALIQVNQNWVSFMTAFNPDGGAAGGSATRQAFAEWKNTALGGNRFCYVCWDTDPTPTENVPATGSLGYILANNGDSGTALCWEPSDQQLAAFLMGAIASVDFNETNGRVDFAFKAQAGLVAGVTDPTTAQNLGGSPQSPSSFGNGYNFYGAYATAGQSNIWFQRNFVTGPFQWLDSYINQIVLNSQMQDDLLTLFANSKSIPFTSAGAALISAALQPTIQQFLGFGAFGPGTLTASQAQQIAQATGSATAANTIATQGWYLQVVQPSASVQTSRGPWQVNFYYLDSGCVQSIALSSVAVQG
jgi:hypothetical protein